jgi:hypothetical protein
MFKLRASTTLKNHLTEFRSGERLEPVPEERIQPVPGQATAVRSVLR